MTTTPRSEKEFVNGLDIVTQHVAIKTFLPMTNASGDTPYINYPALTLGVDAWLGQNIAYGTEGPNDQANGTPDLLVTGLPLDFDVMDAMLDGTMSADQYADWATPQLVAHLQADPRYASVVQQLANAYAAGGASTSTASELQSRFGYAPATT